MRRMMMKSKIHRGTVTGASVDYEGSISIDSGLMDTAGILPYEQVHVFDISNGERLVTYAIPGEDGEICINGAAARKVGVGDTVIILSFGGFSARELESFQPRVIKLDGANRVSTVTGPEPDNRPAPSPHSHHPSQAAS